jgi:predicted nucleotidyltransferase
VINNEIRETLQKVCSALNKHSVEFMVVGGVAVGYYGYIRLSATKGNKPEIKADLDFWYKPTNENYINLLRALEELDVDTAELKKVVVDPSRTFLKIPHKNFHTDFLPKMAGLSSFLESRRKAELVHIDGNDLYIISLNDLIKNKETVNRESDKTDVEVLAKKKKGGTKS